jgi:hypothetical protein
MYFGPTAIIHFLLFWEPEILTEYYAWKFNVTMQSSEILFLFGKSRNEFLTPFWEIPQQYFN